MIQTPFFARTDDAVFFLFYETATSYIGFPKMYLDKNGNTLFNGKYYTKVIGYEVWFQNNVHVSTFQKYLKYESSFGEKIFIVEKSEINEYYLPSKKARDVLINNIEPFAKILKFVMSYFLLSPVDIGVEGSVLLGTNNKNSDLDILLYGANSAEKLETTFRGIFREKGIRKWLTNSEVIAQRTSLGFGCSPEAILIQERRRPTFMWNDLKVSLYCVSASKKFSRILERLGPFSGEFEITDSLDGRYVPAIYKMKDLSDGKVYSLEIYNSYGSWQAKKGEKVYVKAMRYSDELKNNILIQAPWLSEIGSRMCLLQ